jgi:hypothetical protein
MLGDCHVPICRGVGVQFPCATQPNHHPAAIINRCDFAFMSQVQKFANYVTFRDCILVLRIWGRTKVERRQLRNELKNMTVLGLRIHLIVLANY